MSQEFGEMRETWVRIPAKMEKIPPSHLILHPWVTSKHPRSTRTHIFLDPPDLGLSELHRNRISIKTEAWDLNELNLGGSKLVFDISKFPSGSLIKMLHFGKATNEIFRFILC